ncbi:MAG: hypothetical protein RL685_5342 [Pseudomonadota bacterium]|jgi:hypothetical protein
MTLPDWVFENFLFRPVPGRWLAAGPWRQFVTGFCIALPLLASGLLLLEQRARRLERAVSPRLVRTLCWAFSGLAFLAYFDFFNPNTRYEPYYHRHELYHYYLGSKYFDELGYRRLYTCTAIAEVELGRGQEIKSKPLRDLSASNLLQRTDQTYVFSDPQQCKRHFSPERWQAFRNDVRWFESVSRGSYWDKMRVDHGYNPPPVWTMTGQLLSSWQPAGDHFFKALAAIDVSLQLGALLLIGWAFGVRVMALAAVFWGCNGAASFYWMGGAFLRQDWYFLFVAALCLARKRCFAAAGAALAWSALLRVFPLLLFAGPGLIMMFDTWRKRRLQPDYARFLLGAALAGALLVGVSSAVCGWQAYPDFVRHISVHKLTPLTNNMGLEMLLTHDYGDRMFFLVDERLDDPVRLWKEAYSAHAHSRRPLQLGASLLVLGWLAWALRRTRLLWVGMALSVPLLPCLLSLTCYYYSFFVAPALLVLLSPALGPAYLALASASQVLLHAFYWIDDKYAAQSLLFLVFSLCLPYALSRPLPLAHWRAVFRAAVRGAAASSETPPTADHAAERHQDPLP